MALFRIADQQARVVWIGTNRDREESICSRPLTSVQLGLAGIEGDAHGGETRPACSRFSQLYASGDTVRNTRQLSLLAQEDVSRIAELMGLEALRPELVGANIVVAGLSDFSLTPPSSRLQFASGATVVVDLPNGPCRLPDREIHGGNGVSFAVAARARRGVTGWVERPGPIAIGDHLRLFVPTEPPRSAGG